MSDDFVLNAEIREDKGKGASRRLRRAGKVPAIIYGAGKDPTSIQLDHQKLKHSLDREAFYSHILTVNLNGRLEKTILRDLQRHPSKPLIMHMDLLRVREDQEIRVNVPVHFVGEDVAVGVKQQGGVVGHLLTEIEVSCLPKDLPEFIEVDVSNLGLNESLHLSDLTVPEGVVIVELTYGEEHDQAVVNIHTPKAIVLDEEEEDAEAAEGAPEEGEEGAAPKPEEDGDGEQG